MAIGQFKQLYVLTSSMSNFTSIPMGDDIEEEKEEELEHQPSNRVTYKYKLNTLHHLDIAISSLPRMAR